MANNLAFKPEVRAVCAVLVRVRAGERDPALSGLPPEEAAAVRRMLAG